MTLTECKAWCDMTKLCASISYSEKEQHCYLKDTVGTWPTRHLDAQRRVGKHTGSFKTYAYIEPRAPLIAELVGARRSMTEGSSGQVVVFMERNLAAEEGKTVSPCPGGCLMSVESCKNHCDDIEGCLSFTYNFPERLCTLKDRDLSADDQKSLTEEAETSSSFYRKRILLAPWEEGDQSNAKGHIIEECRSKECADTLEACTAFCDTTPACESFVYSSKSQTCVLKSVTIPKKEGNRTFLDWKGYRRVLPSDSETPEETGPSSPEAAPTLGRSRLVLIASSSRVWRSKAQTIFHMQGMQKCYQG